MREGGVGELLLSARDGVAALGRRLRLGAASATTARARSILRRGGEHRKQGGGATSGRVQWREVLVAGDDDGSEAGGEAAALEERGAWDSRLERHFKALRLPTLTYEQLAIPLRLAFAADYVRAPPTIALDVAVDLFELLCILFAVHRDVRAAGRERRALALGAGRPHGGPAGSGREEAAYTPARLCADLLTIGALAGGRAAYLRFGLVWPWYAAQAVRLLRVRDLSAYMAQLNADLTTNVTFFAIFKFALVVFSVPHWVACLWWIISEMTPDGTGLQIPSWTAQYEMHAGVPGLFDPATVSGPRRYAISLFMAWSGVASMGYGSISLVKQQEIWFGCVIILVQIVFYAFVLGTLFHYLVRTDENTVKFKELLKAVDEYARALAARRASRAPVRAEPRPARRRPQVRGAPPAAAVGRAQDECAL